MTDQASKLPSKTIYCYRSNVPLASVTAICSQGWPLLNSIQTTLLHPIYGMPLAKLLLKLKSHLDQAAQDAWKIEHHAMVDMQLCTSAIMYSLDAFWQAPPESSQHIPSLPSESVVIGSAARLISIASWYHFGTSKRLKFPQYRVSKHNSNTRWENFSAWLDDAETIKQEWEGVVKKVDNVIDEIEAQAALQEVHAEKVYKRLDLRKVWGWIDTQISTEYSEGRRETFKTLFLKGDVTPEDWIADDVDDLVEAVLLCCDAGNDISHFIHTRLNHIRQLIADFYSSFTLLGKVVADNAHPDIAQTEQEKQLFGELDSKAAALTELPPAPKREQFASLGLFLKAQAQYNLIARRWNARNSSSKE